MLSDGKEEAASEATKAGGRGQIPTVSVVVPGRSQVSRILTASGALAARLRRTWGRMRQHPRHSDRRPALIVARPQTSEAVNVRRMALPLGPNAKAGER